VVQDPGRLVAAIDIGGTRIKAALVDGALRARVERTTPTPRGPADAVVAGLPGLVDAMAAELRARTGAAFTVAGCGVVAPGLVDAEAGVVRLAVNLGWREVAVRDRLAGRLGVPTAVGHDVRAGLLAETRVGAARGARHAMFVPVGTGIAAAMMVDSVILDADGWTGEIGHCIAVVGGDLCACGQRGCLETVASAAAVERAYRTGDGFPRTAQQVAALAAGGDPHARAVWAGAVGHLATAIRSAATLTGIDLVVVGGGLAESGEQLLGPLRRGLADGRRFPRPVRVVGAALGDRAGCLGAAVLAWRELDSTAGRPPIPHG
jgi:glucokinase